MNDNIFETDTAVIEKAIFGAHAKYLCEYWTKENCNPKNWNYQPSTYGVKGVHLVGTPHMILWDLLNDNFKNPGRGAGIDFAKAEDLRKDIINNGINMKEGSMIYFDVDSLDKMNAFHREYVSGLLGIPGWMAQGVRFDDDVARIRFATKSNNRVYLPHNNTSSKDVEQSVREVLSLLGTYSRDAIRDEVNNLGDHLPESTRDGIIKRLLVEFISSGEMECNDGMSFIPHNKATIETLMPKLKDVPETAAFADTKQWYTNIYNNPEEHTLIMYMKSVEGLIGSLLTSNYHAVMDNKPLHLLFSVVVPEGKETLQTRREKVFSMFLDRIETRILVSCGIDPNRAHNRATFAWNHPDAQHRFVEQDTKLDYNKLVYLKNRTFN